MRRTAVLIYAGTFGPADRPPGAPSDLRLDSEVAELAEQLRGYGFEVRRPTSQDGGALRGAEIWPAIERVIDEHDRQDVVVVHILSHGYADDDRVALRVAGRDLIQSDGSRLLADNADIVTWLSVLDQPHRPHLLFLLDLCFAGKAVAADRALRIREPNKLWILAAATGVAYDGRFTRAVTAALRRMKSVDPDDVELRGFGPFLSLRTFAVQIKDIMASLIGNGLPQEMIGSLAAITVDDALLPFFPNLHPAGPPTPRLATSIPLVDGVDQTPELAHFVAAIRCHAADDRGSAFTGRRVEQETVLAWLAKHRAGPVQLITGRAGTGKSALLGAVVCTTHPAIAPHLAKLGIGQVAQSGLVAQPHSAVMSARNRDAAALANEIGRQLLGVQDIRSADVLVRRLAATDHSYFVVVDAIDEAVDPMSVVDALVVPLARMAETADTPVVKMLVSARPGRSAERLRDQLPDLAVIDLNLTNRADLATDLEFYARKLLDAQPGYRGGEQAENVRNRLALTIERTLMNATTPPELGEFLVIRLYVEWLVQRQVVARTETEAEELGSRAPLRLDELFEKDMQLLVDRQWVRPVLAALAHDVGYGLPAQLIPAIAAGTGVDSTAPSDRDVAATLDSVSRYVTVLPSPDGAAYRLFHDSLAEHLRAHPFAGRPANGQPALFAALLDSVPCMASGERDWRRATWYVRRHILRYATTPDEINTVLLDTGYLLTEAPEVRSAIAELDSQLANAAAAVVDLAATWPRPLTESQRSALAIEAARTRCDRLVESLVSDTGEGLRPIFVTARATPTGSSGGTHVGAELTAITDTVVARYTVAPALQVRGQWPRPAGLNVIAVGAHRGAAEIATQDTDWRLVFRYAQDPDDVTDSLALSAPVTAVTRTDDAFVAASWDGALYEWAGQWRSVPPLMEHALDELTYVPMSIGVGRLVARSADSLALLARTSTGYRTVGRTISGTGRHTVVEGHRQTMVIFCVDNGETFLIYPADGVARRGARRRRPQDVTAIVTVPAQPQPWIVLGDAGGELWSWPFGGDEWQHLGNCDGPVTALTSYQHGDTSFVGSGTEHGEIAIWDLATCTADRTRIDSPVRFLVSQSTKTNVTDVQIAVATGFGGLVLAELVDGFTVRTHRVPLDTDGAVEVADIHLDRPATGFSLPQHLGWTVLVVGHGSGRRSVWHPVTGRPVTGADPSPVIETSDSKHVVLLGDRLVSVRGTRSGTLRLAFDRPDDDEWSISAHTGEVTALATWQHGDTALVVSCGTDRAIRIWDLAGRRMLAEAWLPVPAGQVTVLPDTSAGGYRIVAVTDNDIVVLTGEPKGTG